MKEDLKKYIHEMAEKYGPIHIECEAKTTLPIDVISDRLQGGLKTLSDKNAKKLIKSIFLHGVIAPFFLWEPEGDGGQYFALDGNQRYHVFNLIREAGVSIPGFLPVVLVQAKNEADAKQKLLAITGQHGSFSKEVLDEWIAEIDPDIAETFALVDTEIELAIASLDEGEETRGDDEVQGEAPAVTKLGDLWELGCDGEIKHRLLCGDSTKVEDVQRLMDGQVANLCFSDPPYGVEYQSNKRIKSEKFEVIKNDDVFLDITPIVSEFSKGWVFVWTSWKVQNTWIDMFSEFGYPTNMVIWYKPGGGIGDLKKTFYSDYEVALVWHRGAELCGKRIGSVWTFNKDSPSKYLHPTQKPVDLAIEAIDKTTRKGDLVLDLFGGSGFTLIAAEKTGRKAFLNELSEKYCDVIRERYKSWCEKNGRTPIIKLNGEIWRNLPPSCE